MTERELLKDKKRIVIKIGSSSLTHAETGDLNLAKIEKLVRVISDMRGMGKEVILVSSGAIATGRQTLGGKKPETVAEKQAYAAVGQARLMMVYQKLFSEYNQTAAQILITKATILDDTSRANAKNTFNELLKLGTVPIVNENDTVSTYEIKFGDNDRLSAIVAALVEGDLLFLLSDIDGLYTDDPKKNPDAKFISQVDELTDEFMAMGKGTTGSDVGTGGMATKLHAAKIATESGADIVHERLQEVIWREHSLGYLISGDKQTVLGFKRQDVLDFMKQYYTADRMTIAISGYFEEARVLEALENCFGGIAPGYKASLLEANAQIAKAKYYPSLYMQYKDVEQVHMIIAFESLDYYDPERYILSVVNSLLGGNVNSRLFQTIREEMGLSYAIYSYGGSYEKGGLFHIYAAVHPNQVRPVLKAVVDIIQKLKKELVSDRELYIVKESVKTDLIISDESTYNRISNYGKSYIHGETIETVEEAAEKIGQVTAEEVRAFVQKHFDLSQMSLSLVGDLKTLPREEMEELWMTYRTEKA